MNLTIRTGKMVNGIKGETSFVILSKFDYVKACVPEYVHGEFDRFRCLYTISQTIFYRKEKS